MNLDGKFQDGVRVHQWAGHFSQKHEDHGTLMPGTLQQRRGHVKRCGKVMADEHEVGTAQHGLARRGVPRIDAQHDGIVQHVSRAEVNKCLGGILPPDGRIGHFAAGSVRGLGGEQARTEGRHEQGSLQARHGTRGALGRHFGGSRPFEYIDENPIRQLPREEKDRRRCQNVGQIQVRARYVQLGTVAVCADPQIQDGRWLSTAGCRRFLRRVGAHG